MIHCFPWFLSPSFQHASCWCYFCYVLVFILSIHSSLHHLPWFSDMVVLVIEHNYSAQITWLLSIYCIYVFLYLYFYQNIFLWPLKAVADSVIAYYGKDKMMNEEYSLLKQYDLLSHCFTDQIAHFRYDGIKMRPQL